METLNRDLRAIGRSRGLLPAGGRNAAVASGDALLQINFEARVRRGPNAGTAFRGRLLLPIAGDGAIDNGSWFAEGAAGEAAGNIPVIGTVIGPAINLLIGVRSGGFIYATGMLDRPEGTAAATYRGQFVGPEPDDLGTWTGLISAPVDCRSAVDPAGASVLPVALVAG